MADSEIAGLLRKREIKKSNRIGLLLRNICLISSLTIVLLSILFANSLERVILEFARKVGEQETCSIQTITSKGIKSFLS